MDQWKAMISFVTTLLVLAMVNVVPIDGLNPCPWCDPKAQADLLNCVYIDLISSPALMSIPLQTIDNIKWQLSSDSDSMVGLSYADKKVAMDKKFVGAITDLIKRNSQGNPQILDVMSQSAGNCYSSVTGFDRSVVTNDVKRMVNEDIRNSANPLADSNLGPNSAMPYPANQNQQSNFQPSLPQIQPSNVNNAPFNPPVSPPVNPPNNPSIYDNTAGPSGNWPAPDYDRQGQANPSNNPSFNGNAPGPYGNSPSYDYDGPGQTNPSNNPSFNNNDAGPSGNWPPYDYNQQGQENTYNSPSFDYNAPGPYGNSPSYDYDGPGQANPSNNLSFDNNAAGSSGNWPSNDDGQEGTDFSQNQAPPDSSSGTSLQNNNDSQDNTAFSSTASPKISSQKPSDSDSSDSSYLTTPPPYTDAPQKKTTAGEKSDDEEPCDEKFKIALYDKLINDKRFREFFENLPVSETKPMVLQITKHVFNKYGIKQHYKEFSTFWKFESKTINKESKAEDWDEVISKIYKIIFSRNNLLKGDCEEIGRTIGDYFLGVFPGEPSPSNTQASVQNDGNDDTSTESNSNSASESTINASPENNVNSGNSTNSENPSFPELHSKLSNIFKDDRSTDDVPFSETLATFEAKQNLQILHDAAESCLSPSGFDFDKFLPTMLNVTHSIQTNHPNWSREKCEQEMYSAAVAVLAELLQNSATSSSNNAQSQSSSNQPKSTVDSSDSQNSNSGTQSNLSNDSNMNSDDSAYPWQGTDYASGGAPQSQDYPYYGGYANEPVNAPSYGNQPGPSDRNYSPDYQPDISQSRPQSYQSPDYPEIPPANMNAQPYSGARPLPVNQNREFQQSQNLAPNSGFMNPPNGNFGNNQYQAENTGNNYGYNAGQPVASPVLPNGNSQNFQQQPNQNYDYNVPAYGPANGNNQAGFNSDYNSRFSDNGPVRQW